MTQAAFPPVLTYYDLARLRAEGRCIRSLPRTAIVVRADIIHPDLHSINIEPRYAEWPTGPKSAKVVGRREDGRYFYVEMGTAVVVKGRALADAIEVPEQPATHRQLRLKRTGRKLPWWAARIVWRNVEPIGLAKEARKAP